MKYGRCLTESQLREAFKVAVAELSATHSNATYFWYINTSDEDNDWAIVLGWSDGYDVTEEELNKDNCLDEGGYRLSVKVAHQPCNSMLQCDYDVDWLMPYSKDTMEVDDTELSIYQGDDLDMIFYTVWKIAKSYM